MCPWQQSSVLCCVPGNLEDLALTETPRGPPGAGRGFPGGHASPLAMGLGPCRLCRGPRAPGHTAAAQRAAQRAAALPAALKPGLAWGRGPCPGPPFPEFPNPQPLVSVFPAWNGAGRSADILLRPAPTRRPLAELVTVVPMDVWLCAQHPGSFQ